MNFLKKISSIFCFWRIKEKSCDSQVNIGFYSKIASLNKIVEALNVVYDNQAQHFLYQKEYYKNNYYYDTVVSIIRLLELDGVIVEISIAELVDCYFNENRQIAGVLIDIDYWDRVKDITDREMLIKVLKVNPKHELHRDVVITRLKSEIDKIDLIEELEDYIRNFKDLPEIYIYGANKLFGIYKHLIQVDEKENATNLIEKVEQNIDTSIAVGLRLNILHLKEKNEGQKFLNKINDVNRLDDIAILRDEATSSFVREICQIKINNTIKVELIDANLSDDELIKLYYYASELDIQLIVLSRVKHNIGFIYQESMRHGLRIQADSAKIKIIELVLGLETTDILEFSQALFQICFKNYELAIMIGQDERVMEMIDKISAASKSKSDLIEALLIVGGHVSIIKHFYRLKPNPNEIRRLGNSVVLLNDKDAEYQYTFKLEDYIYSSTIPTTELVDIFGIFKDSYVHDNLKVSIMRKIISSDPQFN